MLRQLATGETSFRIRPESEAQTTDLAEKHMTADTSYP
jgi:hypothetical protein